MNDMNLNSKINKKKHEKNLSKYMQVSLLLLLISLCNSKHSHYKYQ